MLRSFFAILVRLSVVLMFPALIACSQLQADRRISIVNVTAIDVPNGVRHNQTVIVDGDRIASIGPSSSIDAVGTIVDGQDAYLIPGLWDMHVHLTYDERFTRIMPQAFINYGITSVRDTGGLVKKLQQVVSEINARDEAAPRIFFSGPLLDGPKPVYDGESAPEIGIATETVEDAIRNVAEVADAGASFIKIYEMVEPHIFDALVTTAHQYDLPVAAHVPLSMTATEVALNVESLEQSNSMLRKCSSESTFGATCVAVIERGT